MTSTIQELLSWNRRPPEALPGRRSLRDFFLLYAKGTRLKDPDIQELGEVLRESCLRHPGRIGYHDQRDRSNKGPALQTHFYYVTVTAPLAQLTPEVAAKIDPHKQNIGVNGEHTDFGLRKKLTHARTFPLTLDNERIEGSYIKETAEVFSYADPRTEYMIGMTLMILQATENYYSADIEPDKNFLFIPYNRGMITGMLETNARLDTRHKLGAQGQTQMNFVPVTQDELKFSAYLIDYLPERLFTPAQKAIYDKLVTLFPPAKTGQFDAAMDAYLLGETLPDEAGKTPELHRMEELVATPEWINAVQRTALNLFKEPRPSFTLGYGS